MARTALKPTEKVMNAFNRGQRLTSHKMKTLGVKNPEAHIWELRHRKGIKIINENGAYFKK